MENPYKGLTIENSSYKDEFTAEKTVDLNNSRDLMAQLEVPKHFKTYFYFLSPTFLFIFTSPRALKFNFI